MYTQGLDLAGFSTWVEKGLEAWIYTTKMNYLLISSFWMSFVVGCFVVVVVFMLGFFLLLKEEVLYSFQNYENV